MVAMARRRARGTRSEAEAAPSEASAEDEFEARGTEDAPSLAPFPEGPRSLRLLALWGGYLAVVHLLARASVDELAIRPQPGWHTAPGVPLLARWDAGWYQALADQGYAFDRTQESTAGFFPLYSILMKAAASLLSLGTYQGGVVVSSLCLLAAMYLVHGYARRSGAEPWTAVVLLLALPSSFILASVYSESLFLTCALGSFVLARQDRWRAAAVLAALAALTRVHGIVLIPTLLVDAWMRREGPRPTLRALAPAAGALLGFAGLCGYFAVKFHDPWAYFHAKQAWGLLAHDAGSVLFDDWRALLSGRGRLSNTVGWVLAGAWVAGAVTLVRQRRLAEATWVIAYMVMTLGGGGHVVWGVSRYSLSMFPLLTLVPPRHAQWVILVGALLQCFLLVEYVAFLPNAP
jgi:hypothetical protein